MSQLRALTALLLPCLLGAQGEFSPVLGGLTPGSGVALGLEYRKPRLLRHQIEFTAKAIGSVRKYELLEAGLALPGFAEGRLFVEVGARYRNFPEEDFWGLGPETSKDRRTAFRLEDLDVSATFGFRPAKSLETGISLGRTMVNIGPGKDDDWPSTERVFAAHEVPALDDQPDYLHWGAFVRADYRDERGDPRRGSLYEFRWTSFRQGGTRLLDSRRYEIDIRHFIPTFRAQSTVAARAYTVLSKKSGGGQIPFYLQPSVGGGSDLRGHRQARFRDENALVLNLEYRWRVREMIHVVGFTDAGRVFHRPSQISLARLHGSAGAGTRFKLGERILAGFDVGWSREGIHVWFRSDHTF